MSMTEDLLAAILAKMVRAAGHTCERRVKGP